MNVISINGNMAYSKDTALDMLHSLGMDDADIETLQGLLGEEELEEAEHEASVWKQEYQAMKAYAESIRSAMNEVLNMLDEALDMERISKARERMEAMRKVIVNA